MELTSLVLPGVSRPSVQSYSEIRTPVLLDGADLSQPLAHLSLDNLHMEHNGTSLVHAQEPHLATGPATTTHHAIGLAGAIAIGPHTNTSTITITIIIPNITLALVVTITPIFTVILALIITLIITLVNPHRRYPVVSASSTQT